MRLERIAWPGERPVDAPELQRALETEGFAVWRWADGPNASYAPHSHDQDESLWLLEGEITFVVGARELRLRAGDRLMLPAGTVHSARAGSAGATYLIGERAPE